MSRIIEWLQSHKSQAIAWGVAAISIAVAIYQAGGFHWDASKPWVLAAIVALVAIYFVWKIRSSATAEDGLPMPLGDRRLLTGYLLLAGLVIVYMLVSLNSLDFPEPAIVPEPLPVQETAATSSATNETQRSAAQPQDQESVNGPSQNTSRRVANAATAASSPTPNLSPSPIPGPGLQRIFPHYTLGNTPTVVLTLYGQNFKRESKVRFNMKEAPSIYVSSNLLTAPLQASQLVNVGSITVDVENPKNLVSNAITVPVTRPRVPLNIFFFWYPPVTRDVQLLLIVLFAGALGSYVHALKSLGDFIGNRTLRASWFWWYITRPFLGMAMALIFYAVLRGGFLAGTPADAKIVSAFGVLTVGALVGMFADKAAQKLAEVFDVVFKAPDTRGGKLDAPVIDKLDPDTVPVGSTTSMPITISGTRLGKVSSVRVNGDDRKPNKVSENEITFTLKPEDMATSQQITIEAVNLDGGVSSTATVYVSDLAISRNPETTALKDAEAGKSYAEQIDAIGGTGSNKWSLVDGPEWLSIDNNGSLKGTPGPGDVRNLNPVTVKVVDMDGASASKTFNLKVAAKALVP